MRIMLPVIAIGMLLVAAAVQAEGVDPLAELAALGDGAVDTGPEGGGSIRAKKDVDLTQAKRLNDPRNLEAKIETVTTKSFPLVALTVKVLKPAREGSGKDMAKDAVLVITPKLKVANSTVAMQDPDTAINAGAYYLRKGDKVAIRLGTQQGKHWEAEYLERK